MSVLKENDRGMKVSFSIPSLHGTESVYLPDEESFSITLGQFVIHANNERLTVSPLEYHLQTDDLEKEMKMVRAGSANGPYAGTAVVVLPNDKLTVVKRSREIVRVDP